MRTAEEVFHAAREIAKAQLPDGSYVPTSQLTPEQRRDQRARTLRAGRGHLDGPFTRPGTHYSQFRRNRPNAPDGRGLADVYETHGIEVEEALKEETRPSTVHRSVQYGSSISPELEAKIDRELRTDVVRGRPLSFFRGITSPEALAAAASSHVTTGNRGLVMFNEDVVSPDGKLHSMLDPKIWKFDEVLNHEAAHAILRKKNPQGMVNALGEINQVKALGEEARADGQGVRGRGIYERAGVVQSAEALAQTEAELAAGHYSHPFLTGEIPFSPDEIRQQREAVRAHRNYPLIHDRVSHAYGNAEPSKPRRVTTPRDVEARYGPVARPMPRLEHVKTLRVPRSAKVGGVLAGSALIAGGVVALANSRKTNRLPRDADGDGKVFDGTPRERSVAKRIERDELGRFTTQAGAGVAGAGLASTAGSTVAAERMLRSRGPVEIFRPGGPIPASWDKRRRQTRLVRRAGTYGRSGMAAGVLAVGLGTGLPALEERAARHKRKTALLDPPRLS